MRNTGQRLTPPRFPSTLSRIWSRSIWRARLLLRLRWLDNDLTARTPLEADLSSYSHDLGFRSRIPIVSSTACARDCVALPTPASPTEPIVAEAAMGMGVTAATPVRVSESETRHFSGPRGGIANALAIGPAIAAKYRKLLRSLGCGGRI
jgi:hypothetical protein